MTTNTSAAAATMDSGAYEQEEPRKKKSVARVMAGDVVRGIRRFTKNLFMIAIGWFMVPTAFFLPIIVFDLSMESSSEAGGVMFFLGLFLTMFSTMFTLILNVDIGVRDWRIGPLYLYQWLLIKISGGSKGSIVEWYRDAQKRAEQDT